MRENGFIDDRDYALAVESPLKVVTGPAESSDAPYFVDLVNDDLEKRFPGYRFPGANPTRSTPRSISICRRPPTKPSPSA